MGLGAAMTFPATLSLLTGRVHQPQGAGAVHRPVGRDGGVAIALGPIVGGYLLEHYSWSSIFYTLGPVSLAVIALAARSVPGSKNPVPHGLDVPGLILSGGFMGLLVYTIIEAPDRGWTSAASLGGFAGAAVLLIAFIVGERRADQPMLDVRLFKEHALQRRQRRGHHRVLHAVRVHLPDDPVLPVRPRLQPAVHRRPPAAGRALRCRRIDGRDPASGPFGTKIIVTAGLVLQAASTSGSPRHLPDPQLRDHRHPDGRLRPGHGPDLGTRDRVDHGGGLGRQAGVGSAVNDSTRLLGGTLGVAVIGSVYASLYDSRLTASLPATLPHTSTIAHQSIGAAFGVSGQLAAHGHTAAAAAVRQAATNAFDHGLSVGCVVAAAVALAGALLAAVFLPAQPASSGRHLAAAVSAGGEPRPKSPARF